MTTTIQVEVKTLKLLRQLKGKLKARTYDEVIQNLVTKKMGRAPSFLGVHPRLRPFTHEDRLTAHDED